MECINPLIEIKFTYLPGYPVSYDPARGGPGGWDPGEGPELELLSAALKDGDGTTPDAKQVRGWAEDWLYDTGYHIACRTRAPSATSGEGNDRRSENAA